MTINATENPIPLYFDTDGTPLDNGSIYFGVANQNPETNPITVYWDAAGTQPAAQPIKTVNGMTARNGTPAVVYAGSDYSNTVRNKKGALVTNFKQASGFSFIWQLISSVGASLVGFIQSGAGAVARTAQDKMRESVSVKDFGATTASSDNTAAFLLATNYAASTGATITVPAGTWFGTFHISASNFSIRGAGSASTIIKHPAGAPAAGGVIEFGNTALGNSAPTYSFASISGLTLDGNKANVTAPVNDLTGWGMCFTKFSYVEYSDVVAQNCHAGGVGTFINSNFHNGSAIVIGCGFNIGHPGFDVNSSKYSVWNVVSDSCDYGARLLDNCYGNQLNVSIYNAAFTGFVYNNQTVNSSYSNIINVNVVGNCALGQGVSIGSNCYNSTVNAKVDGVTGNALVVQGSSATYAPRGNTFNINSYNCGGRSVYDAGISNQYFINSKFDGRTGAAGSTFAVDINGSYGQYVISVEDTTVVQVRGVAIRSGAIENRIIDYVCSPTVQDFLNQDTSNTNTWNYKGGAVVRNALRLIPLTVATLPSASTTGAGAKAFVSDANATMTAGIGAVVAGGGANNVPVYSDGTNWRIG